MNSFTATDITHAGKGQRLGRGYGAAEMAIASSVPDPTGQAHDVKNLYLADASGFPSSGGAPHTLTIMANALRVASHIVARGKAGTL